MSKKPVPQVEGIKQLSGLTSGGGTSGTANSGDWPVRLRGYYRALKRKEPWALKLNKLPPLQFLLTWKYRPHMIAELVYNTNPFLRFIKSESWAGKYISVPVEFKK